MNFNTFGMSQYTLLMTIVGNNISQFMSAFHHVAGWKGTAFYLLYYLFTTFIVANVLISYFVDAYITVMQDDENNKGSAQVGAASAADSDDVVIARNKSLEEEILDEDSRQRGSAVAALQ